MTLTRRILEKYLVDHPARSDDLDAPVFLDTGVDAIEIIGISQSDETTSTTEDGEAVPSGSIILITWNAF